MTGWIINDQFPKNVIELDQMFNKEQPVVDNLTQPETCHFFIFRIIPSKDGKKSFRAFLLSVWKQKPALPAAAPHSEMNLPS